jgi:hypothetical protein
MNTLEQELSTELKPGERWPSAADKNIDPRWRIKYLVRSLQICVRSARTRAESLLRSTESLKADRNRILDEVRHVQSCLDMFPGAIRAILAGPPHSSYGCRNPKYVHGMLQKDILMLGLAVRRVCTEEQKDEPHLRRGLSVHLAMAQDYIGWIRDCLEELLGSFTNLQ